ncbi:AMP-binding protein [Pseudonocardia sp. WMMC193]|uniref:AMP-binding protein n=1 Tax=Pseudonocardia sp. WMMC193 TaxID=2911965 RepID=UPI001F4780AF|nr:AMP-binding protein [Pseudonocardia sp. WMMC193]MCF7551017.1 AMP-binding protein [Pseudonocardia sp. WMMC193]
MSSADTTLPEPGSPADPPLGVALDALAAAAPDRPALLHRDTVLTRAELAAASNRAARELAELGVREGSLVTIGLPNGPAFYEAVVGAWKLGAIPQPVSAKLPAAELAALIEIADPAVVVGLTPPDGRPHLPADWRPDPARDAGPLPPAVPPRWKAPTSGGSTGRPKIILAGNAGRVGTVTAAADRLRIRGDGEVFAVTAPLYHNAPFMFSLISLLRGGTVLVLDHFDGPTVLQAVAEHRVTFLYAVPTLMGRMLRVPAAERPDVSSVETLLHLGAPCPEHVKRACLEWFGPEHVWELYAGTESQASTVIDGMEWLAHPGSVGRVVSGEMRIGDEEGRPLPVGEVGEVWMRVPEQPYAYLGATARHRDGWESLGDLGRMDAEGYLYLADRRSDMILVGGSNVYPAEVEAALETHPAVLSSCVIGLPDDDLGNRVHALVQLAAPVPDEELRAHVAGRLARQKVPATVERMDHPLREDTGKVRRSALRAERLPSG